MEICGLQDDPENHHMDKRNRKYTTKYLQKLHYWQNCIGKSENAQALQYIELKLETWNACVLPLRGPLTNRNMILLMFCLAVSPLSPPCNDGLYVVSAPLLLSSPPYRQLLSVSPHWHHVAPPLQHITHHHVTAQVCQLSPGDFYHGTSSFGNWCPDSLWCLFVSLLAARAAQ